MIGFTFFLFGVIVTLGMCALGAWSDFRGFRIPNAVSVAILAAFAVSYGALYVTGTREVVLLPIGLHIGAALLVLLITGTLFAFKQLGAGDSKMATVLALWMGLPGLVPFLFYMSLAGGVVAGISLILKKWKPVKNPPEGSWVDKAQQGHPSVPYGIALACGALAAFIYLGYLDFSKWQDVF